MTDDEIAREIRMERLRRYIRPIGYSFTAAAAVCCELSTGNAVGLLPALGVIGFGIYDGVTMIMHQIERSAFRLQRHSVEEINNLYKELGSPEPSDDCLGEKRPTIVELINKHTDDKIALLQRRTMDTRQRKIRAGRRQCRPG